MEKANSQLQSVNSFVNAFNEIKQEVIRLKQEHSIKDTEIIRLKNHIKELQSKLDAICQVIK